MIDKETVARIKEAANIVDVVGDYVNLTRRGVNYMGLCPFHNERTPSFSVNPRRNFCYCFSCHKGGSPVNFIMEKEGVSYHDALLQLAKKYGIKVEERELTDEERRMATEREGLLIAAQKAMEEMQTTLTDSKEGHDVGLCYFYERGVTQEAIREFHLGYVQNSGNHLTRSLIRQGFDQDVLLSLGIAGKGQSGNPYDKYHGRVIFPIMNSSGKVVGFGGRDLNGGPAKYINSPDSVLYQKNQELYGIYQAKNDIKLQNRCYLVEGYLDVISMWQSGIRNVVASSGTALTQGQISLIHRFTDNITILYDGDNAGIKAALRGINMFLSNKMQVSVVLLPDGHDPDSFARAHTPEELRDYIINNETDVIRFKVRVLMSEMTDSVQDRARIINDISDSIACIPNDVQRSVYIKDCSRLLNIDEATVARVVENARIDNLEKLNRERRRNSVESRQLTPSIDVSNQSREPRENEVNRLVKKIESERSRESHPLLPLEKSIISYLVKYGYVPVKLDELIPSDTQLIDEGKQNGDGVDILYTVTDLVYDEMRSHLLSFAYPPYIKLFETLINHIDEYVVLLDNRKIQIENELRALKEKGLKEIASRASTIQEIEKEEEQLERDLEIKREEMLEEFALSYPGDFLGSHEDTEIRSIATEFINDRYVLSSLFNKDETQLDVNNITKKILRAISEWESELLTLHLDDLKSQLGKCSEEETERQRELLMQIAQVMHQRAILAKDCGERILASR